MAVFGAGEHCAGCPARACTSVGSDDACGSPEFYSPAAKHPARMRSLPAPEQFGLDDFVAPDTTHLLGHSDVLFVDDGRNGADGDAIRLPDTLAAADGSTKVQTAGRIAVLNGADTDHERVIRDRAHLGRRLADAGFAGVISPAVSTYSDRPQFETELAMSYTAAIAADIADHLPTVPTLAWRNVADLGRWADWLHRNHRRAFCLDAGPASAPNVHRYWLAGLDHLVDELTARYDTRLPRFFVQGVGSPSRMDDIVARWPGGLTFVAQRPWYEARQHRNRLTPETLKVAKVSGDHWALAYPHNRAVYAEAVHSRRPRPSTNTNNQRPPSSAVLPAA